MDHFRCLRALEVPREHVRITRELGEGQFGKVCEGRLHPSGQRVAIKMLTKVEHSSAQDHFFLEAMTMRKFSHPFIIRLLGVVTRSDPIGIIMEIAEMGQMRGFLKENRTSLKLQDLLLYCWQLSSALDYLSEKQVVHRDIAARNCLVFHPQLVKLADFGLSRLMQEHNYYKAVSKGKMPIKWMAPESIFYRKFTTASDVWMFGVCCWEIFSFGEKPHARLTNQQVVHIAESKDDQKPYLERPSACPSQVYNLLKQCWYKKDTARPSFAGLNQGFGQIFREVTGGNEPREESRLSGSSDTNSASESDLRLAEMECEALKEQLERSIHETIEDTKWLTSEEGRLAFNIPASQAPQNGFSQLPTGAPITNGFSAPKSPKKTSSKLSIDSAESLVFQRDIEKLSIPILHLIFQVLECTESKQVARFDEIMPELYGKIDTFCQSVKRKLELLSTPKDSIKTAHACLKVMELDLDELSKAIGAAKLATNHIKDVSMCCGILVNDLNSSVSRISNLTNPLSEPFN